MAELIFRSKNLQYSQRLEMIYAEIRTGLTIEEFSIFLK